MTVLEANGGVAQKENAATVPKMSKTQRRREKKKAAKVVARQLQDSEPESDSATIRVEDVVGDLGVEIEYVAAPLDLGEDDNNPIFEDFKQIFEKFQIQPEDENAEDEGKKDDEEKDEKAAKKAGADSDDSGSDDEGDEGDEEAMSKKKKKMQRRMKIAELKQHCEKPEVVEIWDTTAPDPRLLVAMKATRNTVPVPRHWCQKRKFLQGKRGIEKPPWQLPDFIEATGIAKMRTAYQEKEDQKKLKQKQKDKMQPKMGKMDIDYQVLHDAFFKYQTKPRLTKLGEVYYEGKEFEQSHAHMKPGHLSEELRTALGMASNAPPPWLIYMQRYGPPPSYPSLKIQGLNAPIPEGARFGYEQGEWGKPPVDETGRPVYGDVFGQEGNDENPFETNIDKTTRWGDLMEEEEEESEEEDEDEDDDDETMSHATEEDITTGIASISSIPSGVETPDTIDLRKKTGAGGEAPATQPPRALYQVLEQQETSVGGALMGSSHTYVVPGAGQPGAKPRTGADLLKSQKDIDVTLRPEELEGLDEDAIKAKYEQFQAAERDANQKEDFSDMVAEQANKQKRKAAAKEKDTKKKYKDFKF
mmetsp:Transcript_29786/g.41131  ORF Transcript_29786/g.41131 Transcript_29786/m.41131 type:complete len:587 (+) Transcript_29786:190-1950(+)|eukprot:CAMPEP_0196583868 /NCGR_PEP_ID=MMETSP1081-20130531/45034_1 /TAXON_ID=36882 /ORGANISM="Pyramimonas amylifera, Strain CCMP720" /LENGTH=586 /DNA_ID=CAMNT_0041904899 /DNA_START=187 /DNA_END=1947 /DNA_ORIENTATION=-